MENEKILVLSDTHDNLHALSTLFERNNLSEYNMIIHCGDYISPFTFKKIYEQIQSNQNYLSVLGNNEGEIWKIYEDYIQVSKTKNVLLRKNGLKFSLNGYNSLILHGWGSIDETKSIIYALGKSGDFKVIFYGHTHIPDLTLIYFDNSIETFSLPSDKDSTYTVFLDEIKSVIINPGEFGGWLKGEHRYAEIKIEKEKNVFDIKFKSLNP